MQKSDSIKEIATALNKAQAEMSGAVKNSSSHYSTYADLYEVIQCIKDPFSSHGLSYSQFPLSEEGRAGVETILMHSSGEWISNTLMLNCKKDDPQGVGSAITYARRFSLQSIAGVPAIDDDGEAATKVELITKAQATELREVAKGQDVSTVRSMLDHFKVKKFDELPAEYLENVKVSLGIK